MTRSKGGGRPSAWNAQQGRGRADAAGTEGMTRGRDLAQLRHLGRIATLRSRRQVVSIPFEWRWEAERVECSNVNEGGLMRRATKG